MTSDEWVREVSRLIEDGDLTDAEERLKQQLLQDPDNRTALGLLSYVLQSEGRETDAGRLLARSNGQLSAAADNRARGEVVTEDDLTYLKTVADGRSCALAKHTLDDHGAWRGEQLSMDVLLPPLPLERDHQLELPLAEALATMAEGSALGGDTEESRGGPAAPSTSDEQPDPTPEGNPVPVSLVADAPPIAVKEELDSRPFIRGALDDCTDIRGQGNAEADDDRESLNAGVDEANADDDPLDDWNPEGPGAIEVDEYDDTQDSELAADQPTTWPSADRPAVFALEDEEELPETLLASDGLTTEDLSDVGRIFGVDIAVTPGNDAGDGDAESVNQVDPYLVQVDEYEDDGFLGEVDESLPRGVTREERALQVAVAFVESVGWPRVHVSTVQWFFLRQGWGMARRMLEREAERRIDPEFIPAAMHAREYWTENDHLWSMVTSVIPGFQPSVISWRLAFDIASCCALPASEELVEHLIESEFEAWRSRIDGEVSGLLFMEFLQARISDPSMWATTSVQAPSETLRAEYDELESGPGFADRVGVLKKQRLTEFGLTVSGGEWCFLMRHGKRPFGRCRRAAGRVSR